MWVAVGDADLGFHFAQSRLRPRNIGVYEVVALEQKLGAVRFGAGVGQAIAEIQAGAGTLK
jgi:hypothetical protein